MVNFIQNFFIPSVEHFKFPKYEYTNKFQTKRTILRSMREWVQRERKRYFKSTKQHLNF